MRFRAPLVEDGPAVVGVLRARQRSDLGASVYRLADLEDEWRSRDFDLSRDALVVEGDDRQVVGYAAVRHPGALVVVAPDHEGRGIGTGLLEWAERRERELGRTCHRQWIAGGDASAEALLRGAGYTHVRSYWRMVRELAVEPGGGLPPGITLREPEVERDAQALHAVDVASFSGNADYRPESLEEFRAEHLLAHDLDPALSAVAEDGARIVGFLLARNRGDEGVGFIDLLAVAPERQRQGLGAALLRTAFAAFAASGLREAQLGVASDNPRAVALYRRVGMSPRFRSDIYERPAGEVPTKTERHRFS
jgi:mycothiol synthase